MSTSKSTEVKRALKIMVVNNKPVITANITRVLQDIGHACVVFTSTTLAWRGFCDGDGDADLLITDTQMPNMSGLELLKAVRVRNSKLPVIVMSRYVDNRDRDEAMEAGANCFLTKSFGSEDLGNAVKAIFTTRAQ